LDIGIDSDNDINTGCEWVLADGTLIQGIDGILRTTYSTGSNPEIIETAYLNCLSDGTFQAPFPNTSTWPIGLNLGPDGEDILETYVPLSHLGVTGVSRIVVETRSDNNYDQLTATLAGDPIIFTFPVPLPTLQTSLLIAFLTLILISAVVFMRRNRKRWTHVLIVLSCFSFMAMTCSIVLDGRIDDWSGLAPLAEDPNSDTADPTIDINGFYACQGSDFLYFRVDLTEAENQSPVADDQAVSLLEDGSLLISVTGSDPDGQSVDFEVVTGPSQGTLNSITSTGPNSAEVTYTPNPDYFGPDSFSFRVFDGFSYSVPATVALTIDPVNDEPSFTSGGDVTVQEDSGPQKSRQPRRLSWAADLDPGAANESGQVLTYVVTNNSNNALFSVPPLVDGSNGELSFTPADDQFGSAEITLHLEDDGGTANGGDDTSPSTTFTITITSENDDPTAVDDTFTVDEDSIDNSLDVLANDTTDPDPGETLTISSVGVPDQGGSVSINAGTNLLYSPLADFFGTETFTYTIEDGNGGSDTASVTVTVENVNDAPTAIDDAFAVDEDSTDNPFNPLSNDLIDPDSGETLSITAVGATDQGGSVNISGGGTGLLYTPAVDFFGTETFTYDIEDGNGGAATATITVTVNNVNDDPTATDDAFNVNEDSTGTSLDLLANDLQSPDSGETLTISAVGATDQGGSVAITAGGSSVSYTPAADFFGQETFSYDLSDGNGGTDTATVTVDVDPVNDAPSFTVGADQTVLEDAGAQSMPTWATNISSGPSNESTQVLTFNVTGNTNMSLFSAQPAIAADGTLTYTPAADANGSSTITLTLSDDGGTANGGVDTSPSQTFTINVTAVNDAPSFASGGNVAFTGTASPQTEAGWATSITSGPTDESGQVLAFNVTGNSVPGLFTAAPSVNAITGDLTYTPVNGASGTATITLELQDDGGIANGGVDTSPAITFDIQITAQNQEPSFTPGADQTVLEDAGAQSVNGWATSIDDGDGGTQLLTFNITGNTTPGLFAAGPAIDATTGNLTYTPATDANGSSDITVVLMDDGGTAGGGDDTSPSATFTINVTAVNDAPSFTVGPNQMVAEDAGAQSVSNWATSISAGPSDESGQTLSFNITNNTNAGLFSSLPAVAPDGTLTYTPAADTFGAATLTIELQDNGGTANGGVDTSASTTFTITVTSVDDPPSVTGESFDGVSFTSPVGNTMLEFSNTESVAGAHVYVLGDVLDNDSDPDSGTLSISSFDATSVQGGVVNMNTTTGEFNYLPPLGYEGSDSFTYHVTDGTTPVSGTVSLTIANMVWYVDNSAAAPGTGHSSNPLDSMTAFNAIQGVGGLQPDTGDVIFLSQTGTTYQSGVTLMNSQHLVGQGVDLVVGGTTLLAATTNPEFTNASGDVVTLADDNIVEGLTLLPVASAGVVKIVAAPEKAETTQKFGTETILRHLTINPAGASHGIEFYNVPSGTLTMHNVTIQGLPGCTGDGIIGDSSDVTLDFDDLALQSPLGSGLSFFGMSGTLTATNVNFDTDSTAVSIQGGDMSYTFNGTSSISQTMGGGALDATLTGGTLDFTSTPISVSNLSPGQDAVFFDAGGNNVVLTLNDLTIDASSGDDALVIDGLGNSSMVAVGNIGLSITGAGGRGIAIIDNNASLSFPASSTVSGTTGTAFHISGGIGSITYAGSLTNASGRVIDVDAFLGTTINFTGMVTENTGGLGLRVASSSGTIQFNDLNLGTMGARLTSDAITLLGNSGTINIVDLSLYTQSARGVVCGGGSPTVYINVMMADSAVIDCVDGLGLDISGANLGATIDSLTVNNSSGGGVYLNNNTNTTNIGQLNITNTGGTGLNATNAGTVNVTNGTSSINTTNGPAIVINPTMVGMTFATVSSTNSPSTGVSLSGLNGNLTMNGGTISGSNAAAFDLNGGNATVTYSGAITNTSGRSVQIANITGGSVTFNTGTITDTGALGILLQTISGGFVSFNGFVDITNSTAQSVFLNGNTGGTFTFADLDITNSTSNQIGIQTNGVNTGATLNCITGTINTGAGVAVDLDNINLGMNLISVSSNGASSGIDLNTTSGSFTVLGDGGGTNNNSGGSIQNSTGDGVSLTNVVGVDLGYMLITSNAADGIGGSGVTDLSVTRCNITNNGDAVDEAGIRITNLFGDCTIENSTVSGSSEHNVELINDTGTLTSLAISGSTFSTPSVGLGADGFNFETRNTAVANTTFTGCTFTNNRSDHVQFTAIDNSTNNVTVGTSNFTGIAPRGINLSTATNGEMTFNISGNTMTGPNTVSSQAIRIVTVSTTTALSTITGSVSNNLTMDQWGFGVSIDLRGNGILTAVVDNNRMEEISSAGVDHISGNAAGDAAQTYLTITDNRIDVLAGGLEAIAMLVDRSTTACVNIRGNNLSSAGSDEVFLDGFTGAGLSLESAATDCGGGVCANADAHLAANNTLSTTFTDTVTLVAPGTCATP